MQNTTILFFIWFESVKYSNENYNTTNNYTRNITIKIIVNSKINGTGIKTLNRPKCYCFC